jgi:GntR family transcriptional regulator
VAIASALRAQIDHREILPGDMLPSEGALCESFDVSRSVVRQALATLEREGLVKKSRGRGTTVCVRPELHRDPRWIAGLSTQMSRLGSKVTTKVLSHELEDVPTHVRGLPGTRVLRLERLRIVDREPVAFIRTWLPAELETVIPAACLVNASLHEQLRLRAGRAVTAGPRHIRAIAAVPPIHALLKVAKGAPLLLLEGMSRDQDGRVIEVFSTWHRGDKVSFDVTVEERPNPRPRGAGGTRRS